MTVRNLDRLFKPASIALIGATRKPNTIGAVVARNLFNAGFDGPIMPVTGERAVEGVLTYKSVDDLPVTPDLAVICTPAATVPATVEALGKRGTKAAIVISSGFSKEQTQTLREAAKPHLMRVLGPNSLGIMVPGRGLNASFGHVTPKKGDVALVAQSSMVVTSIADWATARGIGFSHLISMGDKADVDFGDLLDYLASDATVRAILLYIESISDARKFMSAARSAARQKPVIVIKSGRTDEALEASTSHTGALAVSDAVYDAAFRRAGILRVTGLDELFDAVGTLGTGSPITGDRLAILTNGGGMGVMATDSLILSGGRLAQFAPETMDALEKALGAGSARNPLRIGGDAPPKRYADALNALMADPNNDAVLVLNCPTAVTDGRAAAQAVVDTMIANKTRKHPVLTSWLGDNTAAEARKLFAANRVPTYDTPSHAVRAFLHLVEYRRNQELLMETPPSVPEDFQPDGITVRKIISRAIAEKRDWLSEYEAKRVLAAYGVPVVDTRRADTPEEAAHCAEMIGGPLALKILSPDITHKSDVGGVALHLTEPAEVKAEAEAMLARVREAVPDARIEGFTVQEMAVRADAYELIVGMTENELFGPVLLFGEGGIGVEVVEDYALALPPLNMKLATELMGRTRIWRQLQGYRSRAAVDLEAVALTLNKISQLIVDFPEVAELDVNPLLADAEGVLALDARIKVGVPALPGAKRLAIRPYPKGLEDRITIKDGRQFLVRPILPEDEPLVHHMVANQTQEDLRLRFFAPLKRLSHQAAARLTQMDYDREMGLVAVGPDPETGDTIMYGVVRITADPDNLRAEYAVMVRSDMKGQGLGYQLMNKILDYARSRGIKEVYGEVLRENTSMLGMCRALGFIRKENLDEPGVVEVRIELGGGLAAE
ncbi:GCN5 family acetyltransferase [Azospirillum argentinense]|uniref:GCN5 family acetyltransferase n=1 Tax=Azospirillum argentinense TaxID=2970906 RepID=A0A060DPS8_9PROT|nr:bifunctional acetate--CoA ligase family protein/GNAT family N-acetyltransferase [Azospirillum argentinense]AIB13178.1 GCN5 family acetyltransferase [Azospirillum argentinense]EZQ07410.1 GCN5 family acetyltransferase [Azospirillum argentinense]PNQ98586.1 GNAT family N-acetyltransferase [Azospirillum argentinense]